MSERMLLFFFRLSRHRKQGEWGPIRKVNRNPNEAINLLHSNNVGMQYDSAEAGGEEAGR